MSAIEDKGNGNGANNIPLGASVIAVVDAFDAMTRNALTAKGWLPGRHWRRS